MRLINRETSKALVDIIGKTEVGKDTLQRVCKMASRIKEGLDGKLVARMGNNDYTVWDVQYKEVINVVPVTTMSEQEFAGLDKEVQKQYILVENNN